MEQQSKLKRFLFGKLNRKIFLLFLTIAILCAILLSGLFYYASINAVTKEIKNNLESTVQSRASHIETYFNQDIERIKLVTSRTQFRKDIDNYLSNPTIELNQEIVRKLQDSKNSIEEIEEMCLINLKGIVLACSNGQLTGRDFSKEEFFVEGLKIEGAYFFKHSHGEDIIVSGPISNEYKELMGVIVTLESFEELGEIVEERTGLGKTGEVLVAFKENNGEIVYPVPRLFEEETKNISVDPIMTGAPMKTALEGKAVFLEEALDYRNQKVLAATRYISSVKLGVVAKIDWSEAIGKVRGRLIFIFVMCFIFVLIIFAIVSYLISKSITRPLKELSVATENIRNQNFKTRVNIKSGDELEELGESFNKTVGVLENLDNEKKQIDKAKTEFISITSHELRSPMTPMKAQLQMVLGNYFGKLTKEQRESLQIVLNNTERLDKIIVDFLEISRIEAARLKFNFVRADLGKTVNLVIEEMKGFMPEKKIKIETHVEKLPVIEVDPDRVSQVLRNLLNNAIKFSPENSKIEVSVRLHSGMILFSVKDSGVGIAEKDQRKLFEPFYQVDNMYQHKSGGTGLGLAISRGIVESQNGRIWLNSQLGRGTIFYFTVPLKPVREIKAIKILFSDSEKYDLAVKDVFREFIGPLGDKEFENLRETDDITKESVNKYINFLIQNDIMNKSKAEEFKNRVFVILNNTIKGAKDNIEESAEEKFISTFTNKKEEK